MTSSPLLSGLMPVANFETLGLDIEDPEALSASDGNVVEDDDCHPAVSPDTFVAAINDPTIIREIFRQIEAGDNNAEYATRLIVEQYEPLVRSIANEYRKSGLSLLELRQEGRLGIMAAIEKFDRRRGNNFSACAYWRIRAKISRFVRNNSRTVKIADYAISDGLNLNSLRKKKKAESGVEPSIQDLAEQAGIPVKRAKRSLDAYNGRTKSIDERRFKDGATTWLDRRRDRRPTPEDEVSAKMTARRLLASLNPQQRRVVELLFDLDNSRPPKEMSIEDVAKVMGLSPCRIQEIRRQSIKRMRKIAARPAGPTIPKDTHP